MAHENDIKRISAITANLQSNTLDQMINLKKYMEALELGQRASRDDVLKEVKRSEDRLDKRIDDIVKANAKETERLHEIITTLLKKDSVPAQQVLSMVQPQVPYNVNPEIAQRLAAASQYPGYPGFPGYPGYQGSVVRPPQMPAIKQQPLVSTSLNTSAATVTPVPTPAATVTPVVSKQEPTESPAAPKPTPTTASTVSSSSSTVVVKPTVTPVTPTKPAEVPAAATAPSTQKPLFSFGATPAVNNTTGSALSFGNIFGNAKPKTPVKTEETKEKEEEEEHTEEYEPTVDFKPVCPLPDLVDVVTGEEDETKLFDQRCKMFRYDDKTNEWKERGIGNVHILKSKEGSKYRLVMRREQVFKVCANHSIVSGMVVTKMNNNPKAVLWFCEDFSEEEKQHVKLLARFASPEICDEFKKTFEEAIASSTGTGATPAKPKAAITKKADEPAVGKTVEIPKATEDKKETPAVGKTVEIPKNSEEKKTEGFGDKFKPKEGSWECTGCYIRNDGNINVCAACGTTKDGGKGEPAFKPTVFPTQPAGGAKFSFGLNTSSSDKKPEKFSFGMSAAAAAKEPPKNINSPVFGGSVNKSGTNLFGSSSSTPKGAAIFGGGVKADSSVTTPAASTDKFTFGKSPASSSTFSFTRASGEAVSAPAVNFSFKSASTTPSSAPRQLFGNSTTPIVPEGEKKEAEKPAEPVKPLFGGASSGLTFSALAGQKVTNIFEGEASKKAQEELASQKKSTELKKEKETGNDNADTDEEEYEPNVDFKPVVPLPELVEVVTGEEDEKVLFSHRCKCYKFVKEKNEYVERGVGDVKLLLNEATKIHRVVMRREQVLKVCLNFQVNETTLVQQRSKNKAAMTIQCFDFSDNEAGSYDTLTLRFKDENMAAELMQKLKTIAEEAAKAAKK